MRYISPLLFILARATHDQLCQQIQYLKEENQILRARLPTHIRTTPIERAKLLRFGKPLGTAIQGLITIVTPKTFTRWVRDEDGQLRHRTLRRRRTPEQVRALVVRIARETGWGYSRILGELHKLGILKISRGTVKNILQAHDIEPAPDRSGHTWADFLRLHAQTLWACDFFTKNVWTPGGIRTFHVFALIHIGSRRAYVLGITDRADAAWVVARANRIAALILSSSDSDASGPKMLFRDRDPRFTRRFDATLAAAGVQAQPITPRSPNLNPYIERWMQSIKHECLNHFIVLGEDHLRHLINEYVDYYNTHRPHQGLGNRLIAPSPTPPDNSGPNTTAIICETRLGGLLKHYRCAA